MCTLASEYFATLHLSVVDHESSMRIDFGVTNKFYQVREIINTESANNEDRLYIGRAIIVIIMNQFHDEHAL